MDFPDGPVVKNPPANAGDTRSIPGAGRSAKPMHRSCWARDPEPSSRSKRSHRDGKPVRHSWGAALTRRSERKPACNNGDPAHPEQIRNLKKGKCTSSECTARWLFTSVRGIVPRSSTRIGSPQPLTGNAKECSNYRTIALISHTSKVKLKILQARLQR